MKILKRFLRKVLEYVLEVIEHSLRLLPLSLLRIFQGVSLVDKACLYKFAIDFKGVDDVNKRLYICTKGAYEYDFFNMCFLNNMLGIVLLSLYKGYIPVINVRYADLNIWNMFLKQPFSNYLDQSSYLAIENENIQSFFSPSFKSIYNKNDLKLWCKIYDNFMKLNDETSTYIERECQEVFRDGRRVMGVLCRGTDYVTLRPLGHPIQPTLEQVFSLLKVKMKELRMDYIYLATEEKKIEERFKQEFPGKILINKRSYYDNYYENKCTYIREVNFERENDSYYKGLEYFSSIVILSRCQALIGGNTGGSCAAMFMNNMKYEYTHLFDLGCYR